MRGKAQAKLRAAPLVLPSLQLHPITPEIGVSLLKATCLSAAANFWTITNQSHSVSTLVSPSPTFLAPFLATSIVLKRPI